jgi:hypothetical protein
MTELAQLTVRHCQLGAYCHWLKMLLHFGHALPDHLIGYRWRVPPNECQLIILLLLHDWLPRPLAELKQQEESLMEPCIGSTP